MAINKENIQAAYLALIQKNIADTDGEITQEAAAKAFVDFVVDIVQSADVVIATGTIIDQVTGQAVGTKNLLPITLTTPLK